MDTDCPTPTGLGATAMYANVGIFHAGVCALTFGTTIIAAPIEIIKNKAIAIATVLFLAICIFLFSFKFVVLHITEFIYKFMYTFETRYVDAPMPIKTAIYDQKKANMGV